MIPTRSSGGNREVKGLNKSGYGLLNHFGTAGPGFNKADVQMDGFMDDLYKLPGHQPKRGSQCLMSLNKFPAGRTGHGQDQACLQYLIMTLRL